MAGENPSEFKFDDNGQEPDTFYHEELKDLRVEKISQRLTLLSILLPCLVAVTIYFGYRELSSRVSRAQDADVVEVQRLAEKIEALSKSFNDKLITFTTTLSTQEKDFGASIEGRLFAINKNVNVLQKNLKSLSENLNHDLKKNQDTIEKLRASKVDKKSQAVALEKINAAIDPLQQELQTLKTIRQEFDAVSADLKSLESKLKEEINALAATTTQISKDFEQLQTSQIKLTELTVDKDELALELFKIKKNFQNQMFGKINDLSQRLDAIQQQVDGIEDLSKTQKQSLKNLSIKSETQRSGTANTTGSQSPKPPLSTGTITEKDLIE